MLARPGSSSTNRKGGGKWEDGRCGERGGGEQASSRCVEMAPLHVRTITQGLQLLTRLNSTNRIFHVFFIFFFIMFIASRG